MSHGARVAAAMKSREKRAEEEEENSHGVTKRYQNDEDEAKEADHAQKVVKELYHRYEKQQQRWHDYWMLGGFLVFVAWFLATLYLQRSADVAYQVHSTMQDVLDPGVKSMQSRDEIYAWLSNTLQAVWVDPLCGDGICEAPWEFASYSNFGCRADCGQLQNVQNLTVIQIDLKWDFSHPLGSVPASSLMQQTLWNLAPFETSYSTSPYYPTDNSFTQLSGTSSSSIDDAPNGIWTLDVKRDIFNKVAGAVRATNLVYNASYWYKNYIAAASVLAEMELEHSLLTNAATQGNMSLFSWINYSLSANNTNKTDVDWQVNQLKVASCVCPGVNNQSIGGSLFGTKAFQALNMSMDPLDEGPNGKIFVPPSTAEYLATYCPVLAGSASPVLWEYVSYNLTVVNATNATVVVPGETTFKFYGPVPSNLGGNTYITLKNQLEVAGNLTKTCLTLVASINSWAANMTRRMQNFTIDWRLGDGTRTGKIAARNAVTRQLQDYVIYNMSEMFAPIFSQPYGTTAANDGALTATVSVLQSYYILGPYYTNPQPAHQAITRSSVYNNPGVTTQSIARLAAKRLVELEGLRKGTLGITIPPPSSLYSSVTLGQLVSLFLAAGAVSPLQWKSSPTPSLPDANSTGLGSIRVDYNLVSWTGNTSAYLQCDLASRGPDYLGICVKQNVTCATSSVDGTPYSCTTKSTNTSVEGTLASPTYRLGCELPCDRYYDCTAVCECWSSCKNDEVCMCKACLSLNKDATDDQNFDDIEAASGLNDIASKIATITVTDTSRRKLQQGTTLNDVLTQITVVQSAQTNLQSQTSALQSSVDRSNALAQARAMDTTLVDLIDQGQAQIAANQAAIMDQLAVIIGKQNQSLAAAQQASDALAAIQGLASMQAAAQQALANAVTQQVTAIKSATFSKIITITQALALWKKARRDEAVTAKAALLATYPCTSAPVTHNNFTLDNGISSTINTPRERDVGLTNRVIAGMMLHQVRTNDTNCSDSKFNQIQKTCVGPQTLKPYGVDPVFKSGTTLYNPDYDDYNKNIVVNFYNCTQLKTSTYNITVLNQTSNLIPYCAELYNPEDLPYAFYYYPLKGMSDGFPVFFDINLGATEATKWLSYLQQGLYLDQHTSKLTVELVTYNAPLRIFGFLEVDFAFTEGGAIKVSTRLDTVRVELYNTYNDKVRFFMEIVLDVMIAGLFLYSCYGIVMAQIERRNFLLYFAKAWNVLDFLSNSLLVACVIIWWIFVKKYAETFNIQLRYNIYGNLQAPANYLALAETGSGMTAMWNDFSSLQSLINMLNWYFALNGINILLLIARILRLMDFQPRLGVVTRSLWLAGPDLIHFFIVASMVFIGYSMMAHLIFGNVIEKFATFGDSVNTCFEILLGNIDVNNDLRALPGLQNIAGALFFWSYELLVFMVLLNFLLAIIVDAFSEVKEQTHETVGVHTELLMMSKDLWRSMMGMCSSNYISDRQLGTLLKQWAGEDVNTEDKKGDREVAKLLTVLNEDLDEEDLQTVLLECLKDAPGADEGDGKDGDVEVKKRSSVLSRVFFLPSGRKVVATPEEIKLAAKYIVDRFGVEIDAEEHTEDHGADLDGGEQHEKAGHDRVMHIGGGGGEALAAEERDQLAAALERLAEVQRELADGQRNLMVGQKQLAEQQAKLITLMNSDE